MSDRLDVRRATADDSVALAHVHVAAWRDTYAGLLPARYLVDLSIEPHAERWRRMLCRRPPDHGTFVSVDPVEGIVGYGSCGPNRSGQPAEAGGEVYALYVHPISQGGTVGRHLMAAMADHLLSQRHRSACVWVLRDNPARWFYAHLGGRLVAEQEIPFAGARLMQLAYLWPDLPSLMRLAGSVGDPA